MDIAPVKALYKLKVLEAAAHDARIGTLEHAGDNGRDEKFRGQSRIAARVTAAARSTIVHFSFY